uniref:G_PROTEIN_RECEP_F1_2 domain-containing protein n=1 Tax=Macrostomum lignano TaxID=282301 RepID=A0A1I8FDL1_9PLAT
CRVRIVAPDCPLELSLELSLRFFAQIVARIVAQIVTRIVAQIVTRIVAQIVAQIVARIVTRIVAQLSLRLSLELSLRLSLELSLRLSLDIGQLRIVARNCSLRLSLELSPQIVARILSLIVLECRLLSLEFVTQIVAQLSLELSLQIVARIIAQIVARIVARLVVQIVARIYLLDQWVTQPGHARLRASFSINKKRNLIALEIRDDPPVAASGGGGGGGGRRAGATRGAVRSLDGPFTHTLKLDESAAVSDLPCHTKSRKIKRRKVLLSNGDELEDPDLAQTGVGLFAAVAASRSRDAAYPTRGNCAAEPMWHLLLRYERCVASQMAACRALCQPVFHSRETWQALMDDERQYYRVRMQACYALCMISGPLGLAGAPHAVFLSLFGAKDTRSVTPANDFSNLQRYFLLKEVPLCMSLPAHSQGVCPPEVPEFILNLLRFNDNSKNIYADDYYRGRAHRSHCFELLRPLLLPRIFLAKLPNAYCCAAGGAHRLHPRDIGIFKSYAAPGNYIDVRLAAMEAVVNHIKCAKDAAALAWLLATLQSAVSAQEARPVGHAPELVERLWRLLNTELSADCRLRCSVASLLPLAVRQAPAQVHPAAGELPGAQRARRPHKNRPTTAPTPPPAPADTDDDNANFGLTGAGVGLGSSGDEADLPGCRCRCTAAPRRRRRAAAATPALDEEMLDDGDREAAEDDEDEYSATAGETCLTAELLTVAFTVLLWQYCCPTMSSELQSSHWYQFWHSIDCNSTARWEPLREPSFLAFLCAADAAQCLLCLLSLLLNSLSYLALGRDGSDSHLGDAAALPGRDRRHLRAGQHHRQLLPHSGTLPAPAGDSRLFLLPIFGHPIVWGIRVAFITLHNWLMLFMAAVRFAKIRWPLRANLWFSRRRTRNWMGAIWIVAMATSLVRGLERAGRLSGRVQPDGRRRFAHLPGVHHGGELRPADGHAVVAVMVVNVLLLRTVRRSNNFQRDAAGGGSSPNSTIAVSTVSMASSGGAGQLAASSSDKPAAQKQEKQFRQLTRMVTLLMYMYLICQTPMVLYGFVVSFKIPTNLYIIMTLVGNVISSMDGTCNFFIYVVTNPKFKREVRQILGLATMNATGKVGQSGISMEAVGVAKQQQQQQNRL